MMSCCVCTTGVYTGSAGFTEVLGSGLTAVCPIITGLALSIFLIGRAVRLQLHACSGVTYEPETEGNVVVSWGS